MMTELPRTGPMPRPSSPDEGREVLRREAIPAPDAQRVVLRALEFTSLCPRTGQPDFGRVTIDYRPVNLCLESKALKFYLWSFRDAGEFCEALAARIADDVVFAIEPEGVRVEVEQNVRGGIEIVATALRGSCSQD
jgi:7-cyano-7-deazaguanine reductase